MIRFSKANEKPHGVFSPLFLRPVQFEGVMAESVEHAFQYGKPKRVAVRDWMMAAPSPFLLTVLSGSLPAWEINKGWSAGVHDRMAAITRCKFDQHADLARILDETGDEELVYAPEHASRPNLFWGMKDGKGDNAMGKILMAVRKERRGT